MANSLSQRQGENLEVGSRQKTLPSFQELTNSHQYQTRCSSNIYSLLPPPHSDSQQVPRASPRRKKKCDMFWLELNGRESCHLP